MPKTTCRALALLMGVALMHSSPMSAQAPAAPAQTASGEGLSAAFPEIQRIATELVERAHIPGAVVGVIANGELVFVTGIGDRKSNV